MRGTLDIGGGYIIGLDLWRCRARDVYNMYPCSLCISTESNCARDFFEIVEMGG
jgi:hypothetical protein